MAEIEAKTVNILCLDGGGVRGLSSLLILKKLLQLVDIEIARSGGDSREIPISDVFDVVTGTSTGGLIAIMIVKLGMDVHQCIKAYEDLSVDIFGKPHFRARLGCGLGRVKKFSQTRLREVIIKLMKDHVSQKPFAVENYKMEEINSHPETRCTVVCNQLNRDTLARTGNIIFLCSEKCRQKYRTGPIKYANVVDSACATTAAPTFFQHVEMLDMFLVDGGYCVANNPSLEIWKHYTDIAPHSRPRNHHIVNIGTGSVPLGYVDELGIEHYLPSRWMKNLVRTAKDLLEHAVEADRVGEHMCQVAKSSKSKTTGRISFDRFSANKANIHKIKLHAHSDLSKIRNATEEYLKNETVLNRLRECAHELAKVYLARKTIRQQSVSTIMEHQRGSTPVREDQKQAQSNLKLVQETDQAPSESSPTDPVVMTSIASTEPPRIAVPSSTEKIEIITRK